MGVRENMKEIHKIEGIKEMKEKELILCMCGCVCTTACLGPTALIAMQE